MEYTFKVEEKNRSVPFLEKYKDKISRINRASGLNGALGIKCLTKSKLQIKQRCFTEANEHKMGLKVREKRLQTQRTEESRVRAEVVVNRFKAILGEEEEQEPDKENVYGNAGENEHKRISSRVKNWKLCFDLEQKTEANTDNKLEQLVLPKIGTTEVIPHSVQPDRMTEKRIRLNFRHAMLKMQKKGQQQLPTIALR